ncbi:MULTISPECIES: restriction endonuclease subunit S [Staphylococcus]|uniref:restriction endonuclease subunit S n=1 Tax=Staphylococcus TaxID=1279 RepID=UPI0021492C53|nr:MULTISPECIES: restriction endonuclease subunit S [Staphylococcus]MCQ9843137.1 restriction endonuclease subunit S [Staphylococcus aureus]MCQ9917360.1 restriction endonuclease subunit S [Staphylococcus aureus]MCQ9920772.1 restriction endonuclease subunit S [Staphylococcus aureus]MCQ9924221.1 restriction endonuclease subunit S [Staphylococcus aureus]MCQ9926488.1 restriction endonuclease subunit S [Staphylococcus aureus]
MTEIANTPELRFPNYENSWFSYKLNDISERVTRKNKNLESQRPLTISGQLGLIDQIEYFNKSVSSKNLTGYILIKKGEFAYNKSYSNGYPLGAIKKLERYDLGILSSLYICFSFDENIDKSFMKNYFESTKWYREVANIAVEGARNHGLLNIPVNDFFNININLPIQYEQEKIGEFFSKLDRQIELEEQKLAKLEEQKKGYMQKIFSQKIRFKDENGNNYPVWQENKLENIALKVKTKNFNNEYKETFTNSAEFGIVSQRDFFDKDISNEKNLTNYYIVEENDFVYNPRISNYAPVGPINRNKLGRTGIMSPLYTVFKVENINKLFLEYYFKTSQWHKFMKLNGDSGARSDRFTIKINIFMQMPIMMPAFEEQEKIGDFFSKIDNFIEKQSDKVELLKERKKGFLQKMFV